MQIQSVKRLCAIAAVIFVLFFLVCTAFHTHQPHLPSGDEVCLLCLMRDTSFVCIAVTAMSFVFVSMQTLILMNKNNVWRRSVAVFPLLC